MRLFLLLLPWLELFTLIQLGVATSALAALAYVFLTFVAGLALLRLQGRDLFNRLREAQEGRLEQVEHVAQARRQNRVKMDTWPLLDIVHPDFLSDSSALLRILGAHRPT